MCKLKLSYHWTFQQDSDSNDSVQVHKNLVQESPGVPSFESDWNSMIGF